MNESRPWHKGNEATSSNLAVALDLARAGFRVFPCGPDKQPLCKWRIESTCDAERVAALFANGALPAIDLAGAGLIVIDADRHGGPDGVAAFEALLAAHGLPAGAPFVDTAGRGRHFIFRNDPVNPLGNARGALPKGVDVRGDGGYIIAPDATLPDGRGWRLAEGSPSLADAFTDGAIPALPQWILDLIQARPDHALTPSTARASFSSDAGPRERAFAEKALAENCAELAAIGQGGRNQALNGIAFRLGRMVARGWLGEAEVSAVLEDACRANGLWKEDGPRAVRATIASGMSGGFAKPHEDLSAAVAGVLHDPKPKGAAAPDASAWPDPKPLPEQLLPVLAFESGYLPDSVAPWVDDIAERMQCPPDFVAVPAMVALGSIIGRKIGIRPQKRTDWTEVANLWGMIVARPGAMKSPAMSEALKPLHRLEAKARQSHEESLKRFAREAAFVKIAKDEAAKMARTAVKKGGDSSSLRDVEEPEEPQARRYVVNDTSYEALGVILAANPQGTLAFRDELVSLLKTLDREEHAGARGFYLTAWNGTTGYSFDRIIRGKTHIDAACLSLLGGTQPGRIAEYMQRAISGGAGDDGLIQRFGLLVWPDQEPEWREVDRYPDSDARNAAWDTFERLDALEPSGVGAESDRFDGLEFLRFDEAAHGVFSDWRADLERRLRAGDMSAALESHFSKFRKLVPALALINHLADGGSGPVDRKAISRAINFAEYLETHARRAYGAGSEAETATAKAILKRIRSGDLQNGFTARDVHQKHWANLSDRDQIKAALDLLVDLDWLAAITASTGGRPRTTYAINPASLA